MGFSHRLQTSQMDKKTIAALAVLAVSFWYLYQNVIAKLVNDWSVDDNYSHGFLIIPIALFFVWERRNKLKQAERMPSYMGLVVVIGSMAMLLAGILGSELFLTRVSIIGTIAGAVLFLCGWNHLRILMLPIAFLILMIPIPAIIFNQVAFPLQLLASRFGEMSLMACQVPVLREGNVINLANTSLEVAEACSGIRSLISLLTLGIVYGYFTDSRLWVRLVLTIGDSDCNRGERNCCRHRDCRALLRRRSGWGFFTVFRDGSFHSCFHYDVALYRIIALVAPPQVQHGKIDGRGRTDNRVGHEKE